MPSWAYYLMACVSVVVLVFMSLADPALRPRNADSPRRKAIREAAAWTTRLCTLLGVLWIIVLLS